LGAIGYFLGIVLGSTNAGIGNILRSIGISSSASVAVVVIVGPKLVEVEGLLSSIIGASSASVIKMLIRDKYVSATSSIRMSSAGKPSKVASSSDNSGSIAQIKEISSSNNNDDDDDDLKAKAAKNNTLSNELLPSFVSGKDPLILESREKRFSKFWSDLDISSIKSSFARRRSINTILPADYKVTVSSTENI